MVRYVDFLCECVWYVLYVDKFRMISILVWYCGCDIVLNTHLTYRFTHSCYAEELYSNTRLSSCWIVWRVRLFYLDPLEKARDSIESTDDRDALSLSTKKVHWILPKPLQDLQPAEAARREQVRNVSDHEVMVVLCCVYNYDSRGFLIINNCDWISKH